MQQITSAQNSHFKRWSKLKTRKWREREGLYLLEGVHLVEEALKHDKSIINALIFAEGADISISGDIKNYELSGNLFNELAQTETPQGVIAVCKKTEAEFSGNEKRICMLDAIQDPGNLGTLIRTADAAGFDCVILGKGTVDLYNDKVLRAAQGSHFHVKTVNADLSRLLPALKEKSVKIFGTALDGDNLFESGKVAAPFSVIIGNEGRGVSEELLSMTDQNFTLPIYGKAESLNASVAAGIVMYTLKNKE